MSPEEQIVALKTELAHTIGKLAYARGILYSLQNDLEDGRLVEVKTDELDMDVDRELLRKLLDLTSGDSETLSHEEVQAGFKWMNDRVNEED